MGFTHRIPERPIRTLYGFWATRRRSRVPSVRDMDPLEVPPSMLPWLFLFRRGADRRFRCILSGTGIVWAEGLDATGSRIDDMPWPVDRARQVHLFEEAASTGLPIYYSGRWSSAPGSVRRFSRLLLPLARDHRLVDHIFGMFHIERATDGARRRSPAGTAGTRGGLSAVHRAVSTDLYLPHLHEPGLVSRGPMS